MKIKKDLLQNTTPNALVIYCDDNLNLKNVVMIKREISLLDRNIFNITNFRILTAVNLRSGLYNISTFLR